MKTLVDSPKWNVIALILTAAIGTLLVANADRTGTGMAFLVIFWLPLMIALVTMALYGLSRLLFKKYNWIISLLGILFILNTSLQFFFRS